jgi:hypothetical protein
MKRFAFASLALVFAAVVVVRGGCRVGGEIDPDGDVSYIGGLAK